MGRHKLFFQDSKFVRDKLNEVVELSEQMHAQERVLIERLHLIDRRRYYVRYGFNSLSGFCRDGLLFTKVQAQRIVTQVRRYEPTANIVDRHISPSDRSPELIGPRTLAELRRRF